MSDKEKDLVVIYSGQNQLTLVAENGRGRKQVMPGANLMSKKQWESALKNPKIKELVKVGALMLDHGKNASAKAKPLKEVKKRKAKAKSKKKKSKK